MWAHESKEPRRKKKALFDKQDYTTTILEAVTWPWIAEVKWSVKWVVVDRNTTPCYTLRKRVTIIATLLTIMQSPLRRLEQVPSVEPGRLERVHQQGRGCWSVWCYSLWQEERLFKNRFSRRERKRSAQHNSGKNAPLDPGSDITLCDVSLMEKLQIP